MPFAFAVPGAFLLSYNAVCFCCSRCFSTFSQCRLLLLFQVLFYFLTMPFAFAAPGADPKVYKQITDMDRLVKVRRGGGCVGVCVCMCVRVGVGVGVGVGERESVCEV